MFQLEASSEARMGGYSGCPWDDGLPRIEVLHTGETLLSIPSISQNCESAATAGLRAGVEGQRGARSPSANSPSTRPPNRARPWCIPQVNRRQPPGNTDPQHLAIEFRAHLHQVGVVAKRDPTFEVACVKKSRVSKRGITRK